MTKCRYCGERIYFAMTSKAKMMPVDYEVELEEEFEYANRFKTTVDYDPSRMQSHFGSCKAYTKEKVNA